MRAREVLLEMPSLMVGSVDWGLNDPVKNRRRRDLVLASAPVVLKREKAGTLYRRDLPSGGEFTYVSAGSDRIVYYMLFTKTVRADLGNCATQVKVWVEVASGTKGLPASIFFDTMLGEFDTMVSDRLQSQDGRRFWLRRLLDAIDEGLHVGMLDGEKLLRFDPATSWDAWLKDVDGWGSDPAYSDRRFFISRRVIS